ncbi:MAG: Glucokinase [Candidatus Moanabacter tarae]|uniref:Glucokinase n=1 Tax=Candidatus Moanibacter tarae TaxID=2200854 RepID=A0A2Z4AGS1_9BACT|nr:MAG: Glucokinase [Candidatus Moanabacter tarae]|tara:strand:+ start:14400 stop:15398 length:999 start_codon:yes stop_codon:yes gene_type:complete
MPEESKNCKYWVGFDIGGTKLLATVFDSCFKAIATKKRKTKGYLGKESGLQRLTATIADVLEEAGIPIDRVAGIGIGSPGPLDLKEGTINEAPNLGWKDVKLKTYLEDSFRCPVVVANDVDAGVFGEYRFGAARGSRCSVGVFSGTGIGGGCVYEGNLIRGERNSCMEIGQIPILPQGPLSGSGLRGNLESVASRLAISSAAAAAAYRGEAPHLLSLKGTDLGQIRSKDLAASIEAGDETVEKIVRDAAQWTGYAMAGVVHLLAPDVVVVGGGLVEAMPKLMKEEVTFGLNKNLMDSFKNTYEVRIATLGDAAAVMGAAALAEEEIDTKNNV